MQAEQLVALAATFVAGLAGGWLAHASALRRDRRKERNDAAAPIRKWLLSQLDRPSPYSKRPAGSELDLFRQCLPERRQDEFNAVWDELDHVLACQEVCDQVGQVSYGDPEQVKAALRRCLPFTARV